MATKETQEMRCLRDHGFTLDEGPGGYYVMLPAGKDPKDGAPLTWATPAGPDEAALWRMGDTRELARRLHARGIPVTLPKAAPSWARWLKGLFGLGG